MELNGEPSSSPSLSLPPNGPSVEGVLLPAVRHLTLRCLELVLPAPAQPQQPVDPQFRALPLSLIMPGLQHLDLSPLYCPNPDAALDVISGIYLGLMPSS